ncbi:MAG TPA: glutaredoxin family protein [Anaerolineales bacterium]|nr:glutaredoxin family protein [Anaerolineales bacterium]
MIRVTLFMRPGCGLCDEVRTMLAGLQKTHPHQLVEVDIESDRALLKLYLEAIPVVSVGPYTLRAPITATDLKVALAAAATGAQGRAPLTGRARQQAITLNRIVLSFTRHWLATFNLAALIFVGIPFLAPVLMNAGATAPARLIYTAYSPFCHQYAFRSWFLFGDQAAYPLARAGLPGTTFGEATGLPETDYLTARAFIGNEAVGYKVALCERDVSIWGGLFLAGLAFGVVRGRLRPLSTFGWLAIGILPIALDGGTQLLSGLPGFSAFLPWRESTPALRTITGLLFSAANVWMAYPYVEESMTETAALIAAKLAGATQSASA